MGETEMNIGELKQFIQNLPNDAPVLISLDNDILENISTSDVVIKKVEGHLSSKNEVKYSKHCSFAIPSGIKPITALIIYADTIYAEMIPDY